MGLFSSKKDISIPRRDFGKESGQLIDTFESRQQGIAAGNVQADIASTRTGLDSAGQIGGQIRGLQEQLNPELFQLQGARDTLATGQIGEKGHHPTQQGVAVG